jgi:hypothetical protein
MKKIIFYVSLFVFVISTAHARQYSGELVPSNDLIKKTVVNWHENVFSTTNRKLSNLIVGRGAENINGLHYFYVFGDYRESGTYSSGDTWSEKGIVNKEYVARRLTNGNWVLSSKGGNFWYINE